MLENKNKFSDEDKDSIDKNSLKKMNKESYMENTNQNKEKSLSKEINSKISNKGDRLSGLKEINEENFIKDNKYSIDNKNGLNVDSIGGNKFRIDNNKNKLVLDLKDFEGIFFVN
jgi:hypothetical protein